MKYLTSFALVALSLLAVFIQCAWSLPPSPPGGGDPIGPTKISGNLYFTNCQPQTTDVRVRLTPGPLVTPQTKTILSDGRVRMTFSIPVPPNANSPWTLSPSLRSGVCSGGHFQPSSRNISDAPVQNMNFAYAVAGGNEHRIAARDFASELERLLSQMKLKLHNHQSQNSSIEIKGFRLPFNLSRVTVDIDCGTLCPDLGDGHFYVNDVNLSGALFDWENNAFELKLSFEDSGREIKGYHSVLGDNGMPDFQLSNIKINAKASLALGAQSAVELRFFPPKLNAGIEATGGCKIGGIDVCNKIFGTDRKIQKGIEGASNAALNSPTVQNALRLAIRQFLSDRGITGTILGLRIVGGDILITTR